jgi:glycosyltransferase involved in cell wall biosynthesis
MKLGIIIPCYDEAEGLPEITKQLQTLMGEMIEHGDISPDSFVCYVDDGSQDNTWKIMQSITQNTSLFRGLKLSRNFGHQNALIAGLMQYKNQADALISMDADLQDDITLIKSFVERYKEGYDIVYGVRDNRETDSVFKRNSAGMFYKFQHLIGIKTMQNHADYRLMSQKALEALSQFEEINLFLRGIIPLLGFRSCSVYYSREERFAGETKYPFKKMLLFALDGITSFTIIPLRFITITGFILFLLSLTGILWVLIEKFVLHNTIQGWASTMVSIYFIGGIQVMGLGIIGEYVGRNFQQSKNRPRYIIEEEI